jgi:hypothetical protein
MKAFKIVPQLRENCAIQGPADFISDVKEGDTIFLMKNLPTKKYSIVTKIDAKREHSDPTIFIDQRILGNFGEDEEVSILKYHPAEAKEVYISITDEYSIIVKGDWTSVVKPSLQDKIVDYGREVTFAIPWEGGAPIVATGTINSTLPNPPLFIGDRTKIFINKLSAEKISKIQEKTLKKQTKRVKILLKQVEQKTIEDIKDMKQGDYPNKGQKYEFKGTNPQKLFTSVLNLFKGLEPIEDPVEKIFDEDDQDYLGSAVFLIGQGTDSTQLIDIQVAGHQNQGVLSLYVTGKNEEIISESLNQYDMRIGELKQGLEQKIELFETKCPGCGADLPVEDIDINGNVKCKYCRNVSKIPKVLRY